MNEGQFKQIRRIVLGMSAFRQAKDLADHVIQIGAEGTLFAACLTGIVVSYSRPFMQGDGIGPLPPRYREFDNPEFQATHDELIFSRNTVYAHQDMHADLNIPPELSDNKYKVRIRIELNENDKWEIRPSADVPQITPETLPTISALCDFQMSRIQQETADILKAIASGRNYGPGDYVLGKNFP